MKKRFVVVGFFVALLSIWQVFNVHASSGQFNGTWQIEYDFVIDGEISSPRTYALEMSSNRNQVIAEYRDLANHSVFAGETFFEPSRNQATEVMQMLQTGDTYYRVMIARKQNDTTWIGTWYDNASNVGEFRLSKP